ncbi:MAG: hypothetical protein ACT4P5_04425, partial [Armatimonadota bacterium]
VMLGTLYPYEKGGYITSFPLTNHVGALLKRTGRTWEVLAWGLSCDRHVCDDKILKAALAKYPRAPGSVLEEWSAIREAIRQAAEAKYKRGLRLHLTTLRVHDGWALVRDGYLRSAKPDPEENRSLTRCPWCGATRALLQRTGNVWRVLHWGLGGDDLGSTWVFEREVKKKYPQAPWAVFGTICLGERCG